MICMLCKFILCFLTRNVLNERQVSMLSRYFYSKVQLTYICMYMYKFSRVMPIFEHIILTWCDWRYTFSVQWLPVRCVAAVHSKHVSGVYVYITKSNAWPLWSVMYLDFCARENMTMMSLNLLSVVQCLWFTVSSVSGFRCMCFQGHMIEGLMVTWSRVRCFQGHMTEGVLLSGSHDRGFAAFRVTWSRVLCGLRRCWTWSTSTSTWHRPISSFCCATSAS